MKTRPIIITLLIALVVIGCAHVADVLESKPVTAVVKIGADSAANMIVKDTGKSLTTEQQDALLSISQSAAETVSTDAVWYFAEWLRSKQKTPDAANPAVLATVVPPKVANAVAVLDASGVDTDIANEAAATQLSFVANGNK